jgi:hypothetical protein
MSCAEGVLGHVELVKRGKTSPTRQEPSAKAHRPDERLFGERLGWVTRKCWASPPYFQIGKIIDNVMVY